MDQNFLVKCTLSSQGHRTSLYRPGTPKFRLVSASYATNFRHSNTVVSSLSCLWGLNPQRR